MISRGIVCAFVRLDLMYQSFVSDKKISETLISKDSKSEASNMPPSKHFPAGTFVWLLLRMCALMASINIVSNKAQNNKKIDATQL
jgi:hypothetical protein